MCMEVTIPEAVLLLAIDDERGRRLLDDSSLDVALAAAALAQLVHDGRMLVAGAAVGPEHEGGAADPGRLIAADGGTDARLEPLVARVAGKRPAGALKAILGWTGVGSPADDVRQQLLHDFEEAEVLVRERDRVLGIPWRSRWERGERREVEDAVQARARAALDGAADPELHAALAILHGAGALPLIFPDRPGDELRHRGAQLAAADWVAEPLRSAVAALQAGMSAILLGDLIGPDDR